MAEIRSDVIEHKCPNCGATITFDIESQMVVCEFCGSSFDPSGLLEKDMGLSLDSEDIDLPTNGGEEWSEDDSSNLSEYSCSSCGGSIYTESTTSATMCPFCGSSVILKGRLSGTLMPDKVIPFKKTRELSLEHLDKHCFKKRFVPKGFKENNRLDEIKGVYVPFWVYDAKLDADVTFTGVKERLLVPGKNSDVVERKYYRVTRKGQIAFDHVPADGSSKMPDDLMESLEPFDYSEAVDFSTAYLSGYVADKYDVPQEEMASRVRKRMSEETEKRFKDTVDGFDDVYLKESKIETTESNVEYVLYPVWLFNLKWEDKDFTFAMNGQTGKMVGNLPVDRPKLLAMSLAIFFISMACAWFTAYGDLRGEEMVDYMCLALVISAVVSYSVYYYFSSRLRSVEFREGSEEYYREDSFKVDEKDEELLYRKIEIRHN